MSEHTESKRLCSYCHAEEYHLRPVGNFIVELQEVEILNEKKLVCQSCRRKVKEVRDTFSSYGFTAARPEN